LTVRDPGCQAGDLKGATLEVPEGHNVSVTGAPGEDPCFLTAKITIEDHALIGVVWLRVISKDKKVLGLAPFEVSSLLPGPTPPGLPPQVDVMWGVIPKNIVKDNFGHEIANNYYCIQVAIGNNSGYDLQIVSLGFDGPALKAGNRPTIVPTAGYPIARGSLERGQETGLRNYLLRGIKGFGPILTGFTPFFIASRARANYSTGVDIFSNPLEKGYELVIPDLTLSQLNRLEAQMLRDGLILSNNSQRTTVVFFPRAYLFSVLPKKKDRDDINIVRAKLGELVLEGVPVEYKARIRVVSSAPGEDKRPVITKQSDTSNQPLTRKDIGNGPVERTLVLEGKNLEDATVVVPPASQKVLQVVGDVQRTQGKITVKLTVAKDAPDGDYELEVRNPSGAATVTFTVPK
jgi:hypothetical protein